MYPWQNFIIGLSEHLAWPIVAISCALLYRKNICQLLDRIKKVGDVEFSAQKNAIVLEQQNREIELDALVARKSELASESKDVSENKECVK